MMNWQKNEETLETNKTPSKYFCPYIQPFVYNLLAILFDRTEPEGRTRPGFLTLDMPTGTDGLDGMDGLIPTV